MGRGSEWLKRSEQVSEISGFGEQVADLLDDLFSGIYNINKAALHKRVKWADSRWIEIVIGKSFSTYDYADLTRLVFLCHERAIRCEIDGAANGYLRLCFSPRKRSGMLYERHPSIHDALRAFESRREASAMGDVKQ